MEEVNGPRKQRYQKSPGLKKRTALMFSLATAILIVVICTLLYSILSNSNEANTGIAASGEDPLTADASGLEYEASPGPAASDNIIVEVTDNELPTSGEADNAWAESETAPTATDSPVVHDNEPVQALPSATSQPQSGSSEQSPAQSPVQSAAPSEQPASTASPATSTASVKLPATYIVQKGDTLSSISEKFYKSKNHVSLIAETNGIAFINDMKAGDKLTIPALSIKSGSSGGTKQETRDYSKVTLPASYMVQAQDTLSSISLQFFKSKHYVDYIAETNNLDKNAVLKAGSILTIPSLEGYKQSTSTDNSGSAEEEKTVDHVVKKGETLYSISEKYYGTNKHAMFIADYNHIVNVDDLKAGTVLKIPQS